MKISAVRSIADLVAFITFATSTAVAAEESGPVVALNEPGFLPGQPKRFTASLSPDDTIFTVRRTEATVPPPSEKPLGGSGYTSAGTEFDLYNPRAGFRYAEGGVNDDSAWAVSVAHAQFDQFGRHP